MAKTSALIKQMDKAAIALLKNVSGTEDALPAQEDGATIGGAGANLEAQHTVLKDQVSIFTAVTRYLAVKHGIDPDGDDSSGIAAFQRELNGGTGRRRRNRPTATDTDSDTPGNIPTVADLN